MIGVVKLINQVPCRLVEHSKVLTGKKVLETVANHNAESPTGEDAARDVGNAKDVLGTAGELSAIVWRTDLCLLGKATTNTR